jgi:hypothetical protein
LKESIKQGSTSVGLPGFAVFSFSDYGRPFAVESAVMKDAYAGALVVDQKPGAELGARIVARAGGPVAEKATAAAEKKKDVYSGSEYREMRAQQGLGATAGGIKEEVEQGIMADVYPPDAGLVNGAPAPGEEGGTYSWSPEGGMEYISPQEWEEFTADQAQLDMTPNEILSEFWGGAAGQEVYQGEAW